MTREDQTMILDHSYRITRTSAGLKIETLDYHAGPATISIAQLRKFGLVPSPPRAPKRRRTPDSQPPLDWNASH